MKPRLSAAARSMATNVLLKALSSPVEKVCRLVVIVAAAKALGASAFGALQYAVTVTLFLALGTELGLSSWTTRAVAADRGRAAAIVATSLRLRLATFVPYVLLLAAAVSQQAPGEARRVMAILGVAALASAFVDYVGATLRGHEDFRREAAMNMARALVTTAASLIALAVSPTLSAFALGSAIGSIASAAIAAELLRARHPGGPEPLMSRGPVRVKIGDVLALWLTGFFSVLYFRCDVVLLRQLAGDAEVGIYTAAYRVFEAWTILPGAVIAVAFPALARVRATGEAAALEIRLIAVLVAMGLAAAALSHLADERIVAGLLGSGFAGAAASFRVLVLALPVLFLNYGLSTFLLARGRERSYLVLSAGLLVLNVGLNLILIPSQKSAGAAWVTLATEAARAAGCAALWLAGPSRIEAQAT